MGRCVECGTETPWSRKTGAYSESFICEKCLEKYEIKDISYLKTIKILAKKGVKKNAIQIKNR